MNLIEQTWRPQRRAAWPLSAMTRPVSGCSLERLVPA